MKKLIFVLGASVFMAACSTNSDGSINWSDNPIERAASKLSGGIQTANKALTPKSAKRRDPNAELRMMLDIGYIKRNPEYPKYSSQRYVFTSVNCADRRSCYLPSADIAPRP